MAVEVKELTSRDFEHAAACKNPSDAFTPSTRLTGTWTYILNTLNATEYLASDPHAAAPPMSRKKLTKQLITALQVLEEHNIDDYYSGLSSANTELAQACAQIHRLVRNGQCARMPQQSADAIGLGPGVLNMGASTGHARSGDPNELVGLLQRWIDRDSANMCDSLAGEPGQHHGVLVADSAAVGDTHTAHELGERFLPTAPLTVPPEIHYLWILIGPVWLRYDCAANAWTSGLISSHESDTA
ncbi:hypothetical protein [Nocardia asiatica]|uniref:hypothetical protein n=1 Tax=Nocardia asiatica TaxID=209252 RepID=UPI0012FB3886|nr:hypothetical protein [Nocardia asiatica]